MLKKLVLYKIIHAGNVSRIYLDHYIVIQFIYRMANELNLPMLKEISAK